MAVGNYSVDVSTLENGKLVKGTLTLFIDEYVFAGKRISVDWEKVVCEQGTERIKVLFHVVDKPCVVFMDGDHNSKRFILEPNQMSELMCKVQEFSNVVKAERIARENKARREAEAKQRQIDEESRTREEVRLNAKQEYQQKRVEEQQKRYELAGQEQKADKKRIDDKLVRIKREVSACAEREAHTFDISPIAKKAAAAFLDNPYRILGVSCLASYEEANSVLDKLKKLSRLKALSSYRSPYDIVGIDRPVRDLSVAQNALIQLKDKGNKIFWFAEPDACTAWYSGKYRIELSRDGEEYGTYDLFLANYMYALLCDPDFNTAETWKRILNFYCYICKQSSCDLLRSRFSQKELQNTNNTELLNTFRAGIFKPILLLCERDDLDAIIRLHKYIKDCNNRLLDILARNVLSKLVSWFTDKEADVLNYLREIGSEDPISSEMGAEIKERGEAYCRVVEAVLEPVLLGFRGDMIRYEMIKESYRHATYQLMYELNKCANKSDAIYFANKCYGYCSSDDKKRIQNTFGEVNIKSIDWNEPHTAWDIKGDDFYYGRGCAVDYMQALHWYHKAADAGNMYSPNSIGICYQKGQGVPQNDEQAALWFEKAYKAGNPQGAYNLAECFYAGTGVRKDLDQSLRYWAEAAKLGHPFAAQRREDIFSKVQIERRSHRLRNHICHDLGFQMTTGPSMVVEVTLSQSANAFLVNAQGYQNYLNGKEFTHYGGYASSFPYRIKIPSSNHWYVIVDNGDLPITGITSRTKVKRA